MKDKTSPEEKLLNLIKNKSKNEEQKPEEKKESTQPAQGENVKQEQPHIKTSAKITQRIILTKNKIVKAAGQRIAIKRNYISLLNKLLLIVFIASAGYLIYTLLVKYKSDTVIPEQIKQKKMIEETEGGLANIPSVDQYTSVVNSRQLFKMFEQPKPKAEEPKKPKITLQQILAGYTFIGIIFGDPPQAIVEEKRTKQSFYLSAGQFLGEVKIEKIEKGKVTVSYNEETMDIRI